MLAGDAQEGVRGSRELAHTEDTDTGSRIDRSVCLKVGYKLMNRTVFSRLRQVFGCSECEHCGQLFSAQDDLDVHSTVHTAGRLSSLYSVIYEGSVLSVQFELSLCFGSLNFHLTSVTGSHNMCS